MILSPELAILHFLATRASASAPEIGISCRMTAAEVHARLVMLESMRMVVGRRDLDATRAGAPRIYIITGAGRRKVEPFATDIG